MPKTAPKKREISCRVVMEWISSVLHLKNFHILEWFLLICRERRLWSSSNYWPSSTYSSTVDVVIRCVWACASTRRSPVDVRPLHPSFSLFKVRTKKPKLGTAEYINIMRKIVIKRKQWKTPKEATFALTTVFLTLHLVSSKIIAVLWIKQ